MLSQQAEPKNSPERSGMFAEIIGYFGMAPLRVSCLKASFNPDILTLIDFNKFPQVFHGNIFLAVFSLSCLPGGKYSMERNTHVEGVPQTPNLAT